MHAVVVGAGISGLAAAVALRRDGNEVTVVERVPALTEVGAGVVLGAHAMRALDALGAADHVRAVDDAPERFVSADMVTGVPQESAALRETGEVRSYTTHRRDLIDGLALALDGATVRTGSAVTALQQDAHGVTVTLADGRTVRGDVLIGADGLRSTVRSALFGESPAIFTGVLAWRTVRPMEVLDRPLEDRVTRLWTGARRHIVCYPIRKGRQFYAAFYVPQEEVRREDWTTSGDVADLRASFADACPDVRRLTAVVDEAFLTGIHYRDPLPTWHSGRVVLLGDAAHPVLPTSGSGAAMALEDAIAIAACLRRHPGDPTAAFAEFEARRMPRTTRLLHSSRATLRIYHEADPATIAATGRRNAGIRQLQRPSDRPLAWLHSYDESVESARPVAEILASTAEPPRRPQARAAFDAWRAAFSDADSVDGWLGERVAYDRFVTGLGGPPPDTRVEWTACGGVRALRVVPPGGADGPAVLHLHGGGYVYGSAAAAAGLAARIARAVGGWALVPDHRLVPEHDAATLRADVRTAHDWLAGRADRILISGECAGGGLALGLVAALRDDGAPLPGAAYLLSPFLDMALDGAGVDDNAAREPWLSRERLTRLAGSFIQTRTPEDPEVSPARGDLAGLPPLRVFAAADEALVDDARRLHAAAERHGVDSRLVLAEDSVHSYALFESLAESRRLLAEIAEHSARLWP